MIVQPKTVGTTIIGITAFAVVAYIVSLSPVVALLICGVVLVGILLGLAGHMVDTNKWPWE